MRFLVLTLAFILLFLQARLWLADGGLREVWKLQSQVTQRTENNRSLESRNAVLEAEVEDLKEGLEAAEERARNELGMVHIDEIFYQITRYQPPVDEQE
tara:strand:- start:94 stop:390 length:297 start_codon:yes stop_codon:yes gene_type:complete